MATCIKYFKPGNRKNSTLFSELTNKYGFERATYLYENVIHSDRNDFEHGFNEWFYEKNLDESSGQLLMLDENDEPLFSEVVGWVNYVDRVSRVQKTFITNSFKATPSEFIDLAEGFTYYLTSTLFDEKGLTPEELLDVNEKTARSMMNKGFNKLIEKLESREVNDRYSEMIKEIKENKVFFYKSINNYLMNKLAININLETVLSDEIETKQDKVVKDSAFNKSSIEFDTKDGAPASVKLLIASLPNIVKTEQGFETVSNQLGLPSLANYNETFNYIQQRMLGVANDIDSIIDSLREVSDSKPELKVLIKRLNFAKKANDSYNPSSDNNQLIAETQLRTQFVNQFNKVKLNFALHIIDGEGNIKVINANQDNVERKIINEWRNAFELKLNKNPQLTNNIREYKEYNKSQILNLLGIEGINPKDVDDAIINDIRDYGLNSVENITNMFNTNSNVASKIKSLARMVITDETVDFQVFNTENKLVYAITLNSYISTLANELALSAGNVTELNEKFPEIFKSPYSKNSLFLNKVVNGFAPVLGLFDGFRTEDKSKGAVPSKNLKNKDLILQRLSGMLQQGQYTFLRAADRGIEYYVKFDGQLLVTGLNEAKEYYKNHLLDEIEATRVTDTNVKFYDKNNKVLRVFGYEDSKGKIHKLVSNEYFTLKELQDMKAPLEHPKVNQFIDDMVENIIRVEEEYLKENQILDKDATGQYAYLKEIMSDSRFANVENIISLYALNMHIGNLESTKLFSGDLAYYKSPADVFKRMSMMNSTKNSLRTDDEILYILNELDYKFEKGSAGEITNRIKTVTLEDIESDIASEYSKEELDTLKSVFKDNPDFLKTYAEINEADGFAYVTIDGYRRMQIRAGAWTKADEKLYNSIASGNYSYSPDTIHRWTMKKFQYNGKLFNEDLLAKNLNVPAGRKFAIMPLIPGLVGDNTTLGKLNNQMLENGVEMAFFTSTAKFGYTEFKQPNGKLSAHQLYGEDGKINSNLDLSQNHDILDYMYMGDQLKIHNKPKSSISGTQRNKIIFGNFYENGSFKNEDSSINELLEKYQELQKTKALASMNNLNRKLGFTEDSELNLQNIESFVENLINQGLRQGYSANDIYAIENLVQLPVFEALPNKNRLESLLTSTLNNNAITNKRRGDMLAQASDVGFEVNVSTQLEDISKRHNLKFYRYAKDGKTMLPMEIMVPLPNELIQYVIDKYSEDGVLTEEVLDKFNKDIERDQKRYEDTLEQTKLTKARTYSGFRIPTQDASSLDVAQVKKFFMPHMTGMVVVPKAIVAKTGSDFDIDKINFYMPNLIPIRLNGKKIAKSFIKDMNIKSIHMENMILEEYGKEFSGNLQDNFYELILNMPESSMENDTISALTARFKQYLKNKETKIVDFVIPESSSKKPINMNKMELENNMLFTENKIILHPDNHLKLLAPLTESKIRSIATEISKQVTKNKRNEEYFDVFYGKTNVEKFIAFLAGKAGVGQVAVHITNHILSQAAGLQMKSKNNYFVDATEGWIDMGRITNENDENISQILSELLTAYVDIAKDPFILEINAISQTVNTILMMLRWGTPIKNVFYFMNQPIIKDYLRRRNLAESVSAIRNVNSETKEQSISSSLMNYGINAKPSNMIYFKEQKILEGDLNTIPPAQNLYPKVKFSDLKRNLTSPESDYQYQMLDLFLEYQRQSRMVQDMIRAASPDTQQFKNVSILDAQIKLRNQVENYDMFQNYDKIFNKTFIGEYFANKREFYNAVKDLFITQHPNLKLEFDSLKNLYMSKIGSPNEKLRYTNMIDNEFINYRLGKLLNWQNQFGRLFKGPRSIPKIIMELKNFYKTTGTPNPLLENLEPLINYQAQRDGDKSTGAQYDSMKLSVRKLTESERETMVAAFEEMDSEEYSYALKETFGIEFPGNTTLGENIWLYSMIQSGMNNHPFSLKDIISAKTHLKFMKKIIGQFEPNSKAALTEVINYTGYSADESINVGEFVLNNPQPLLYKDVSPLKVQWESLNKNFGITHSNNNLKFAKRGTPNVLEYHGQVLPSSITETTIEPSKSEALNKDNPLNDC